MGQALDRRVYDSEHRASTLNQGNIDRELTIALDELLCAGDAIYQFRFSNEVIARLREVGARFILGNHEEILLSDAGVRAREASTVDRELLAWTNEHPRTLRVTIDGKTLFICLLYTSPSPRD